MTRRHKPQPWTPDTPVRLLPDWSTAPELAAHNAATGHMPAFADTLRRLVDAGRIEHRLDDFGGCVASVFRRRRAHA